MSEGPLISCLCVTRGKADILHRAVTCFQAQTYVNRELLLIFEDDDNLTSSYANGIKDPRISTLKVPSRPKSSLGQLRNLAIEKCKGDYFCQWDDDDWYHTGRLEFQLKVVDESRMRGSIMIHWLIYDMLAKTAYISGRRLWEGSVLCERSLIAEGLRYDDLKQGEDTRLVHTLFTKGEIFPIIMPKLYIYIYHGKNIWNYAHWQKIFQSSRKLSTGASGLIHEIVTGKFSPEQGSALLDQLSE